MSTMWLYGVTSDYIDIFMDVEIKVLSLLVSLLVIHNGFDLPFKMLFFPLKT